MCRTVSHHLYIYICINIHTHTHTYKTTATKNSSQGLILQATGHSLQTPVWYYRWEVKPRNRLGGSFSPWAEKHTSLSNLSEFSDKFNHVRNKRQDDLLSFSKCCWWGASCKPTADKQPGDGVYNVVAEEETVKPQGVKVWELRSSRKR